MAFQLSYDYVIDDRYHFSLALRSILRVSTKKSVHFGNSHASLFAECNFISLNCHLNMIPTGYVF